MKRRAKTNGDVEADGEQVLVFRAGPGGQWREGQGLVTIGSEVGFRPTRISQGLEREFSDDLQQITTGPIVAPGQRLKGDQARVDFPLGPRLWFCVCVQRVCGVLRRGQPTQRQTEGNDLGLEIKVGAAPGQLAMAMGFEVDGGVEPIAPALCAAAH